MGKLNQLMSLKGRRVVITGATGALGRVISDTMAELGAELWLVDRPGSDFSSLTESLGSYPDSKQVCFPCNLEDQLERAQLAAAIRKAGALDVLINNAAFVGASDLQGWALPFEQQSVETWRRAMEVNVTAVFDLTKLLAEPLRQSAGASVINVGSIYGVLGPNWGLYEGTAMANPAAYAASKGGVVQLTRWMATTLAPDVRVNCVSPGGIFRQQPDVFVKRYEAMTPLGRMATEDDFRGVFAYLASDMSQYVTGQNLTVDGGWSAW